MKTQTVTCVICPVGCEITVDYEGDKIIDVRNNNCKRGYDYASAEVINPVRILTSTVKLEGMKRRRLAVRSAKPVPKSKLMDCMAVINRTAVSKPVRMGDVIIPDILGTGTDIIASENA